MNFGQAFLLLFALAKFVDAGGDETPKLRGLKTTIHKSQYYVNSYSENLGVCTGAMCGVWGDPHVLTCDGLGYDCNAVGLFTVMKNFLYNIQAQFINVNSVEMGKVLGWGNYPRATYTTNIAIKNEQNPDIPIMQFGFPEFIEESGLPLEEHGCFINFQYRPELAGHIPQAVDDVEACRIQCEETDGCVKFHFCTGSKNCHLAGEDGVLSQTPSGYSRTVAGEVGLCGHPLKYEGRGEDDDAKAYMIGNDIRYEEWGVCPLLYYEDGILQDISNKEHLDYIYGDANSPTYVQIYDRNKLKIVTTTDEGNKSEIMLEAAGQGPGQLFGCHFNLFVCLPQEEQDAFENSGSLGLLGTPDGNSQNDWMDVTGNVLTLPTEQDTKSIGTRGKEAYEYCIANWCVSQDDSFIVPPKNATYDDIKCLHEDYVPVEERECAYSHHYIEQHCENDSPILQHQCEVECCVGNCDGIELIINEISNLKTHSVEDSDTIYDTTVEDDICVDGDYAGTGETVCPSGPSIVKVTKHSADLPDNSPIIYGITFPDSADDNHGKEVSFHVAHPFGESADAYVRYEKKVGLYANDPACEKELGMAAGCDADSTKITVGCIEYPGVPAFALVDVYFAGSSVSGSDEVQKCCQPEDYDGVGVVKYSFKIECECPGGAVE